MKNYFSLEQVLKVTWGRLINLSEDRKIFIAPSQICTDTRSLKKGDFFLALKGEKHDGNDFLLEAHKKEVRGAMTNDPILPLPNDFFLVQVRDTLRALQELAKFYRNKLSIPIVAVTGSNGKTTVKELIAHILSNRYLVSKSQGNFNNQIGLPLSILKITSEHQAAVLELGMNQRGEIKTLSRISQPDIGVITNVYSTHLGPLGTIAKIAQEKAEIIPFLNKDEKNFLILNEDDSWTPFFRKKTTCKIVTFAVQKNADFRAKNIKDEGDKVEFDMSSPSGENVRIKLPLPGLFNVYNVLAASAVCSTFGFSLSEIKKAIGTFSVPPLRYQIEKWGKYNILNDCYNANPESMKSILSAFKKIKGGRKIAILGDMLELGEHSALLHKSVGEFAASCDIDTLLAYGNFAAQTVIGAKKGGIKNSFYFDDKGKLVSKLLAHVNCGDWLLVKGSRGTRMEEVISMLKSRLS